MNLAPRLSESAISSQIRSFLESHDWRVVRNQRTVVPGQYQTSEPGTPDLLAIRYLDGGKALVLWLEIKRPGDRRQCRCRQNLGSRKRCTVCDQKNWQQREARRGASVWIVADLGWFMDKYDEHFGWLHSADCGDGQLDLLGALRA